MSIKNNYIALTPKQMFEIIEDFADNLWMFEQDQNPVDRSLVNRTSQELLNVLNESDMHPRISILLLLQTAVALYHVACQERTTPKCPTDLLN